MASADTFWGNIQPACAINHTSLLGTTLTTNLLPSESQRSTSPLQLDQYPVSCAHFSGSQRSTSPLQLDQYPVSCAHFSGSQPSGMLASGYITYYQLERLNLIHWATTAAEYDVSRPIHNLHEQSQNWTRVEFHCLDKALLYHDKLTHPTSKPATVRNYGDTSCQMVTTGKLNEMTIQDRIFAKNLSSACDDVPNNIFIHSGSILSTISVVKRKRHTTTTRHVTSSGIFPTVTPTATGQGMYQTFWDLARSLAYSITAMLPSGPSSAATSDSLTHPTSSFVHSIDKANTGKQTKVTFQSKSPTATITTKSFSTSTPSSFSMSLLPKYSMKGILEAILEGSYQNVTEQAGHIRGLYYVGVVREAPIDLYRTKKSSKIRITKTAGHLNYKKRSTELYKRSPYSGAELVQFISGLVATFATVVGSLATVAMWMRKMRKAREAESDDHDVELQDVTEDDREQIVEHGEEPDEPNDDSVSESRSVATRDIPASNENAVDAEYDHSAHFHDTLGRELHTDRCHCGCEQDRRTVERIVLSGRDVRRWPMCTSRAIAQLYGHDLYANRESMRYTDALFREELSHFRKAEMVKPDSPMSERPQEHEMTMHRLIHENNELRELLLHQSLTLSALEEQSTEPSVMYRKFVSMDSVTACQSTKVSSSKVITRSQLENDHSEFEQEPEAHTKCIHKAKQDRLTPIRDYQDIAISRRGPAPNTLPKSEQQVGEASVGVEADFQHEDLMWKDNFESRYLRAKQRTEKMQELEKQLDERENRVSWKDKVWKSWMNKLNLRGERMAENEITRRE